jgi:hypothetical protein
VRNLLPSNSNPTLPLCLVFWSGVPSSHLHVLPFVALHEKGAADISFLENPSQIISEYI